MPVRGGQVGDRRRRRTPEVAQREIVEAAEGLLRERPFRELTVDEVMRRTGLSRPSFYVYFKDRHELVLRVVGHLETELLAVANRWYESLGGGPPVLRDALQGIVSVYGQHSAVLRALADAATDDPEVEAAYTKLIENFITVTAEHIELEARAGNLVVTDPGEAAHALVWMNERYLYYAFGPERSVPQSKVLETLATIWTRALYATT
ncbi:MAG: TetR/AcrR family transcriptional regulator, ethionamide resistance regulator [Solirubrobacteraceae bacterium]|nr:TetR/AcrR family transcriptional regulator, ethionamide resistance regulator [Solirubrobacteraceae bacterium]